MSKYKYNSLQSAWLNALETGRFRQGRAKLAKRNIKQKTVSYCCLGVACVVAHEHGVDVERKTTLTTIGTPVVVFNGEANYLSSNVRDALKLHNDGGGAKSSRLLPLSTYNDTGKTHKEIAAIIRANPRAYFKD